MTMRQVTWEKLSAEIVEASEISRRSEFYVELGNYQQVPSEAIESLAGSLEGGSVVYADELEDPFKRPYWWRLPGRKTLLVAAPEWHTMEILQFPWLTPQDRDEAAAMVRNFAFAARLHDSIQEPSRLRGSDGARHPLRDVFGRDWDAPWLQRFRQILAFPALEATAEEAVQEFLSLLETGADTGDSSVVFIALGRRHAPPPNYGIMATIHERASKKGRILALDEKQCRSTTAADDEPVILFSE